MKMVIMTDLLTKHGAALKLGITSAALGKLVREKRVPHVELPNGEIRFDPLDLEQWVQFHKIQSISCQELKDA